MPDTDAFCRLTVLLATDVPPDAFDAVMLLLGELLPVTPRLTLLLVPIPLL